MQLKDLVFLLKKALNIDRVKTLNSKDNNDKKELLKPSHYRLVIINDITFRESFSAVLTRKKVYFFLSVFFVLNLFFWTIAFSYTPLRAVLPEEKHNQEKEKLVQLKKEIDSLEKLYLLNDNLIKQYKEYFVVEKK